VTTVTAQRIFRRFGSIQILRDGRVRFSSRCFPDLPHLGFLAREDLIDVERAGRKALYIWLDRNRVGTVCFAFTLGPDALRELVSELRRAGRGLERWIVPGLEYTQANIRGDANPDTCGILPELLESCRDLPVAEGWRRYRERVRSLWAKRLRKHPQDAAKVPAAWMLPDGYEPSNGPGTASTSKATVKRTRAKARAAPKPGKRTPRK
jgi:hypothetical protein